MEFAEIARNVGIRTGRGASDIATRSFVNEALALYSNDGDWPWLRATEQFVVPAQGQTEWPIPYLCRNVVEVRVNGATIGMMPDATSTGGWWSTGTTITFNPALAAGRTVTVVMYRAEPPLVDNTSAPLISDLNIWPIIDLAAGLVWERAGTPASLKQAEQARNRYAAWLKSQRGHQHRTTEVRIKVRGDFPQGAR